MLLKEYDKDEIKTYLTNILRAQPEKYNYFISSTQGARNLDLIIDLIASSSEISNIYAKRSYQESRIDTAIFENNIVWRAKELGYRITRKSPPIINFKYIGETPITITPTFNVGSITIDNTTYGLFPFQNNAIIEYGDTIPVIIGLVKTQKNIFSPSSSNNYQVVDILKGEDGLSVSDQDIMVYLNGVFQDVSTNLEDYIVLKEVANFSENRSDAKIYVADLKKKFGQYEVISSITHSTIDYFYILTNGFANLNDEIFSTLSYDKTEWLFSNEIVSYGTDMETTDSIAENAPYIYSIMRRAVTEKDFVYLLRKFPIIADAVVNDYGGILGEWDVEIASVEDKNYIILNSIVYSYMDNNTVPIDLQGLYKYLFDEMQNGELVKPELVYDATGAITKIHLVSLNSRSLLNFECSSNITLTQTIVQVPARSCIGHTRYVLKDTPIWGTPLQMTEDQYNQIMQVVDDYRQVGFVLFWEMALPVQIEIKWQISLNYQTFENSDLYFFTKDDVMKAINDWLNLNYQKKINVFVDTETMIYDLKKYINNKFIANVLPEIYDFAPTTIRIDREHYADIKFLLGEKNV